VLQHTSFTPVFYIKLILIKAVKMIIYYKKYLFFANYADVCNTDFLLIKEA